MPCGGPLPRSSLLPLLPPLPSAGLLPLFPLFQGPARERSSLSSYPLYLLNAQPLDQARLAAHFPQSAWPRLVVWCLAAVEAAVWGHTVQNQTVTSPRRGSPLSRPAQRVLRRRAPWPPVRPGQLHLYSHRAPLLHGLRLQLLSEQHWSLRCERGDLWATVYSQKQGRATPATTPSQQTCPPPTTF